MNKSYPLQKEIICKECNKLKDNHAIGLCCTCYSKQYYYKNKIKCINHVLNYQKRNPEMKKKCDSKYFKTDKGKLSKKRDRLNNKLKYRSRAYTKYRGYKELNCKWCNSKEDLHFHHTDYINNTGFTLCKNCHNLLHKGMMLG